VSHGQLHHWRNSDGLEALWEFSRSILFIHDDSIPESLDPLDVTSYHPLLLQPDGVIVPDGDLLKGRFGAYLWTEIGSCKRLYNASHPSISALRNVRLKALSSAVLTEVHEFCDGTSVFHSDRQDVSMKLDFIPPILETQSKDALSLQNRIYARKALTKARIPTPKGREVDTYAELEAFCRAHDFKIAVRTKSKTAFISNVKDCQRYRVNESMFPLWVECWYPTLYSPNAQIIIRDGRCSDLFVSRQILKGTSYQGNCIGDIPQSIVKRCLELTRNFANSLSDYFGIIGIDFIVTTDRDILAVDVNARFNSSTIPFWWLLSSPKTNRATVATFCQVRSSRINLDELPIVKASENRHKQDLAFSPITSGVRGKAIGYHLLRWR